MKNKFLLLLAAGILSTAIVSAHADYRPGCIITNASDTITGYILFKNNNALKCAFRKTPDADTKFYVPGEIKAFRFSEGKYFISKEVPTNAGNKLLFLEYLIQGKANIYFSFNNGEHYYIETETNKLVELSEPKQILRSESGMLYEKTAAYKQKLTYLLSDCPAVKEQIDRTTLEPSSLIELAKDYHNKVCGSEKCIIFEKKIKHINVRFGAFVGIAFNKLNFGQQVYSDFGLNSLIGCKVEVENSASVIEQLSIRTGITLQQLSKYKMTVNPNDQSTYLTYNGTLFSRYNISTSNIDVDVKALALKIPIVINYTFIAGKIRPYVGGGLLNLFTLSQNKNFQVPLFYAEYKKSFPLYQVGLVANIGAKYQLNRGHELFVEFGCEYLENMNLNEFLRLSSTNLTLTAGFTL